MVVKLLVKSVADPTFSEESVYPHARITIGRDEGNLLVLPDQKRIISKEHAEIRTENGRAEIVDLGSKNFTYLNGTRLPSNQPSVLTDGDIVRLGDYEIEVQLQEAKVPVEKEPQSDDRTVFAFNPFWEDVGRLRTVLTEIQKVFAREMPQRRREALHEAVSDAVENEIDAEVAAVIASALAGGEEIGESERPTVKPVPEGTGRMGREPSRNGPATISPEPRVQSKEPKRSLQTGLPVSESDLESLANLLLTHAAQLMGIPWRFRHEFIGQTIMQSDATAVLYDGDEGALKAFLLDPTLSEQERERRMQLLDDAADALRVHLIAVIDGYRGTAREGIERFLDEIDLRVIEQQVVEQARWYEKPFAKLRALKLLVDRVHALRAEDWAVTERRVFRPAFIKAYLARMTSSPRS